MELTGLLKSQYTNYHFSETLDGDDVKFSYRLQEGPADSRNAIRLLRALGYDKDIADSAEERARRFEETGIWTL
jgi:DNA mismatch repair ATPase MutS